MSRYIDADVMRDEWLYESGTFEPNDVLDSIDSQPTVDAVPIVRCGECRHFRPITDSRGICDHIDTVQTMHKEWFCADGEREVQE